MKKIILSFAFLLSIIVVSAQCTPDPLYYDSTSGAWPDTITNFDPATLGVAYNQVLDFKIAADAGEYDPLFAGTPIDSVVLTSVTGLPAGLSYSCNNSTCVWLGGSQGCASLSGTPTALGSYDIVISLDGWVTTFLGPFSAPQEFTGYVIDVGAAGIETIKLNTETFILQQNIPNPANNTTKIQFISGKSNEVTFNMINLLGDIVLSKNINVNKGVNDININLLDYAEGVYLYSVTNGTERLTKRMIIAR